jgi:Glycosyltransferase family 87/WD40-like Beta Propeller Repeat
MQSMYDRSLQEDMRSVAMPWNRRALWVERVLLCLSLLYLCVHTLPQAWRTLNTDFPNYYMAARLAHEGYDTSRMYEWSWIEREKDHRAIDIRVIGLLPITPFSTLAVWPLTGLAPLTAKHIWILLNLGFLVPIGWMLRAMTRLSYQQIALAFTLCFPLYRNLLFGQFYVLVLLLIVAACWSYLRGFPVLAGTLVGIAAACKVFPVLLLIFFLQRREWRALVSGIAAGLTAVASSVAVFGWNVHRAWLYQILPWTLHGEGLQPYVTSASISGVLHCLFLSEPQWNPHPWHSSPLCYALLLPVTQIMFLAPAVLLIRKGDRTQSRILLEWSALLTAALTISTIPASYNFVLMVLPACVLASVLLQRKRYGWLAALIVAYLGIGFPMPSPHRSMGLALLLYVPRLPLMLGVLCGIYALLWRDRPAGTTARDWTRYAWVTVMIAAVILNTSSTLHLERAEREEYAYRLPLQTQGFLNSSPQSTGTGVRYSAFTLTGYHLVTQEQSGGVWFDPPTVGPFDDLSFTSGYGHIWVERASSPGSQIVDLQEPSRPVIDDGREPMLAADGRSLAFLRDDHGRGRLLVRRAFQSNAASDVALTPPRLNVYEASYVSEGRYAFSAVADGRPPEVYLTDATHTNSPIGLGESRYPSISPDGKWMAYSRLGHGMWNLWLRDQETGTTRRIADAPCNQIQPSWEGDSKTILYDTDCGRSVWFTAVARRRVIP